MAAKNSIARVLEQHTLIWIQIPGVLGTAEGVKRGKPCILVLVEKKTKALEDKLPQVISGFPVVLKEIGRVKVFRQ